MDYREYLKDSVLRVWPEHGLDRENGGVFTCVDEQGRLYGREKSVWFQGRALWVFSKAYNVVEKLPDKMVPLRDWRRRCGEC